ncbi:hypothetical protein COT44_02405 [Candidatus Shapirobacteria bacterium CG08_land_8_20_14_0_20_39_18]|uniref:Uncharacterized protein n=1 Tax=Candidatus Shapirobacteria bacterium CG08_land_8_20_14_0_20_39_18 TaxID=1974883 RepID=A0A2M6XD82_9BACT|nr:MAG: hypothetical protein COT44_02405 [Candidatus Shapirobacteria bacterium CG08_land_8_20_14_0_20_39_18]PIY66158.1 MAG: hypothetical protein COY91_01675 [Candidatus Shapirobacteria bacterium CG_4_10_14_0_8_um_filter_39_15]PJE68860.1 MAG: hypothetical protein COU94_00145 [Candidatus Shapirobacteria bacterium CG10_big_fil_rev_8_21_14_0_10_38_8]
MYKVYQKLKVCQEQKCVIIEQTREAVEICDCWITLNVIPSVTLTGLNEESSEGMYQTVRPEAYAAFSLDPSLCSG